MADELIKVRIEADMDFGDAQVQLEAAKQSIRGMKEEMTDMPNISRMLNSSLEKTASVIDSVSGKVEALSLGKITDDDKKESFIQLGNEAIKDINVMQGLQTGSSLYGVEIARGWFKDLPQAVQKEFDAITPRIVNILRSRMSSLAKDGIHYDNQTATSLAYQMMQDETVKDVLRRYVKTANTSQIEGYLQRIVPHSVAHNRLNEWHEARYGSAMTKGSDALIVGKPETLIPASYVSSFIDAQMYRPTDLSEAESKKVLSADRFADLRKTLEKYPIAVKAAEQSGIARRDDRGVLEVKRDLTRADWEDMREALYKQLENRASGAGNRKIDIYDPSKQSQLAKRLVSSSAGAAVLAMYATEPMSSPDAWVDKTDESGYVKQQNEARRILDRYATRKYSPFISWAGSFDSNPYAKENSQFIMIPESQNTKLLSDGKWKNNQDISDTVALISLAGYDPDNQEQFNQLRDLYANGRVIDGVKMVAQSTHGTGSDTVIRMISEEAYKRVEKQEQEWARQNGFSGSYFQNFTDAQRAEMAAYQAKHPGVAIPSPLTEKILGKQYDAENKAWSPSADMQLNLEGKRFAVVDLNGQGDGAAWLSDTVMPYSNQSRFGLGGKGSIFTYHGKNNREFAQRAGLLDDQGRWMAKGLNGEMYDIADYDGVIPSDVVKNLLAYGHIDPQTGEFVYGKAYTNEKGEQRIDTSNEAVSEMMTAALRRYGPRAIANYEDENTNSNKLGAQMTSFMMFSPEMQAHQAEMYAKRMLELDTEEGQLRYVFNNKEEDWLAAQVNTPEGRQLLATPTARKRVDDYRDSLQKAIAAGQYIDFGQDDTKISDVRLADNMLRAFFVETAGEKEKSQVLKRMKAAMAAAYDNQVNKLIKLDDTEDSYATKLERARETVSKDRKRNYTDQELLGLLNLQRNEEGFERIADFEHVDQKYVGVLRSPTGYGNMVYAENVASELAPIFERFGINKTGTFVSRDALETLQSADYDGDRAKIVTGELAEAVRRTELAVREQKKRVEKANKDIKTQEVHYDADITDDPTQRALAAGRNVVAPVKMGGASGGIRGMQVDLSNPINNKYVIAQEKMQKMYDKTSVFPKSPEEIDLENETEYWDTQRLGREFTKFTDKAGNVFQYDSDQLDEYGNVKESAPDIYKTSSGRLVNMRRVRDLHIDETNLPSVNMSSHLMGLGQTRGTYKVGGSDTSTWDALAEAFQHLEVPEGAGEKAKALIMAKRQMFPQFGSGERAQITTAETIALERMLIDARSELRNQAKEHELKGTGVFLSPDKKREYKSADEYVKEEGRRYGFNTIENALNVFGPTQKRLRDKFGDEIADKTLNNDSITELNGVVAGRIVQQAEETAKQAAEAIKEEAKTDKPVSGKAQTGSELRQEARELLSKSGLNKNDVENIMAIPHDELSAIVKENDLKTLQLIPGIGKRKAQKAVNALSGSSYIAGNESQPETPPERLVECPICHTKYPESLGECPNAANHPSKKEIKKDQKQLAKIQETQDNPYQTMEQTYGKALSDFAGIEATKALAMKAIENNDRILQGYRKINKENKEQTQAEQFYQIKAWERRKAHEDLSFIDEKGNKIALSQVAPGERDKILKEKLEDQVSAIDRGYVGATRQWGVNYTDSLVEQMNKSVNGLGDEFDKQQQQIKAWADMVKEAESALNSFKASRKEMTDKEGAVFSESDLQKDQEAIAKMEKNVEKARQLGAQGFAKIQTQNNQAFEDRANSLYNQMYGKTASPLENVDRQVTRYKDEISKELERLESAHRINPETGKAAITDADYESRVSQFLGLQGYADTTLRDDLYKRIFDYQSKQNDRLVLQADRLTRQRRRRAATGVLSRASIQNENEYQQREILQETMQTRLDELLSARNGRLDAKTGQRVGGMKLGTEEYARATKEIDKLSGAMQENQKAMNQLRGPAGVLNATFESLSMGVQRLAMRFGRQLFQKALTEAKRFVQEFNKSMTTIQMITLKTNEQMSTIGDNLIAKSKDLKISVSEMMQSAETLYRQGLSDQEVNERLDIISKFSKVSGTKIDAATKLVTIAMNTGLVTDPQVAADIVTALGDNAATNAAEIEKGIEKAGAAAAADGTTFGELAAMLTAITSTTQIGGNVAGRTINTIFGRMNKIGTNELIYDENGNAVSGSAVAKLLTAQGVDVYDKQGNKRSSYSVLYDLSQKWDSLSDAMQQEIAAAIAGTRQYSNFSAIMQGMSEGKVDQYMDLLQGSSGIVDEKYKIYVESLEASLANLKNTFDDLIHDLISSGIVTDIVDGLSNIVQGIDNVVNSAGGLPGVLSALIPIAALMIGLKSGSLTGLGVGLSVAAIGGFALNAVGSSKSANDIWRESVENRESSRELIDANVDKAKKLGAKGKARTEEETSEFNSLLSKLSSYSGIDVKALASQFDSASVSADKLTTAVSNLGESAEGSAEKVENYDKKIKDQEKDNWAKEIQDNASKTGEAIKEDFKKGYMEFKGESVLTNPALNGKVWTVDENGQAVLSNDVHDEIFKMYNNLGSLFNGDYKTVKDVVFPAIADMFVEAANYHALPEGYNDKSKDFWLQNLFGLANGGYEFDYSKMEVPTKVWQAMLAYQNSQSSNQETLVLRQRRNLKNSFAEKLTADVGEIYSPEEIDVIAQKASDEAFDLGITNRRSAGDYAVPTYQKILGISNASGSIPYEDMLASINAYLGNVPKEELSTNKKTLEPVNEGGYYIDLNKKPGEQGYYVSKEQAEANWADYEKSLQPATTKKQTTYKEFYFGDQLISSEDTSEFIANAVENIDKTREWLAGLSRDTESAAGKAFNALDKEGKETFAFNMITQLFEKLGLKYTGTIAEFLKTRATDMFTYAEKVVEEETKTEAKPLEEPNYKAVNDYALGGRSGSYSSWSTDKNNAYKLAADRVLQTMRASGATNIDQWLRYVNENGVADFNTLYQNGAFGNLMMQVNRNPETGEYTGPADMMDQLVRYLLSSGTRGAGYVSARQKADYAQSMYNTLVKREGLSKGEQAYFSYADAEAREREERNLYEKRIAEQVEYERKRHGDRFTDDEYAEFGKNLKLLNPYTGFVASNARVYSEDEKAYLKETVGEELYDRLTGQSDVVATEEEKAYAQLLINNKRYGISNLTSRQRLTGIQDVQKALQEGKTIGEGADKYSQTVAKNYLTGWSDADEYLGLLASIGTDQFGELEQKRLIELTASLNEFEKSLQIKVDIEGIQQLEEVGELLDGTTAKIEQLKKGGKFAIEASFELENQARSNAQFGAKLTNGTRNEKIEALRSLGFSDADIEENFEDTLARGIQYFNNTTMAQQLGTLTQWYGQAEDKDFVKNKALSLGYKQKYDNRGFELYGQYEYDSTSVNRPGYFFGKGRAYSDAELARARLDILNGKSIDADLKQAASASFGRYGAEYRWQVDNKQQPSEELKTLAIEEAQEAQDSIVQNYRNQAEEYYKALAATQGDFDDTKAGTLASYLGRTESQVREMSEEDRLNELNKRQKMLIDSAKQDLSKIESLENVDFSSVTDFDGLISAMKNAVKSADAEVVEKLREYINIFEGVSDTGVTDFGKAYTSAKESLDKTTYSYQGLSFIRNAMSGYTGGSVADYIKSQTGWQNDWNSSVLETNGMVAAMSMLENGQFTPEQFTSFLNSQMTGAGKNHDYYDMLAKVVFGNNYSNGEFNTNGIEQTYADIQADAGRSAMFEELLAKYPDLAQVVEGTDLAMERLNEQWDRDKVSDVAKYAKGIDGLSEAIIGLADGDNEAAKAQQKLRAGMKDLQDKQTAIEKSAGVSGKQLEAKKKKGDQTLDILASMLPFDAEQIANMTADEIDRELKTAQGDINNQFADTIESMLLSIPKMDETINLKDLVSVHSDGSIELSDVRDQLSFAEQQILDWIMGLAGEYSRVNLSSILSGDTVTISAFVEALRKGGVKSGANYSRKSGGGGGGGKSKTDELLESLNRDKELVDHRIKMAQYEETKYENDHELTNKATIIRKENELQKERIETDERAIERLKEQLAVTKEGSDDWYKLAEAIRKYEEDIEDATIATQKNKEELKNIEKQIRQMKTDIQDLLLNAYKEADQVQRDMLSGRVSFEQSVLDIIRSRYQKEWELQKEDIDKKKKALEEEKALIDERLNRRKEAADEAEKYEELSEMKKQLALIEADSSRTREARELREKIAKQEKDIAWDTAEEEAKYEKDSLDDQIEAYDNYISEYEEYLEEFLSDANNFADEVGKVLGLEHDQLIQWLKDNDEEYQKSLDNTQEQMVQSWDDTWMQMVHDFKDYWKQIAEAMLTKEGFLGVMQGTDAYLQASEDQQATMLQEWSEMWDNWHAAQRDDQAAHDYSHEDDTTPSGSGTSGSGGSGSGGQSAYTGHGYKAFSFQGPNGVVNVPAMHGPGTTMFDSKEAAEAAARNIIASAYDTEINKLPPYGVHYSTDQQRVRLQNEREKALKTSISAFKEGGYVDYTGLAMVHGTPDRPEAYLNAEDTALLRSMLDAANYVKTLPYITNVNTDSFRGNSGITIDELRIEINEAELKEDADYNEVARKVAEAFTKELSMAGINTSNYSF